MVPATKEPTEKPKGQQDLQDLPALNSLPFALRIKMVVGCLFYSSSILCDWGDLTHSLALWKWLRLFDRVWVGNFPPASWARTQAGTIVSLLTCTHLENIFHEQLAAILFYTQAQSYEWTSFIITERQLSLCSEWCSVEIRAVLGLYNDGKFTLIS